jgi:hypothetical protein
MLFEDMVLRILRRKTGNVTETAEDFMLKTSLLYRFLRKCERQQIKGGEADESNKAQRRDDKCLQDFVPISL